MTVTPLSTHISCQGQSTKQKVVGKVLLKAVARSGKKSANIEEHQCVRCGHMFTPEESN